MKRISREPNGFPNNETIGRERNNEFPVSKTILTVRPEGNGKWQNTAL